MFFRYITPGHPALVNGSSNEHENAIEDLYVKMDELIGRVRAEIDDKSLLIIMSDHGFKSFKRGMNINSWLHQNGYLALKEGADGKEWYQDVDWDKTRAFAVGLGGIFLNIKGREAKGIVEPEEEKELKKELIDKLRNLKDEEAGERAIIEVFDKDDVYKGPYVSDAPELFVGFKAGYRASWDCAVGKITDKVFEDNTKNWSGDHSIDPRSVPGVFFCNRKINVEDPNIMDIGPTVLNLFGLQVPKIMDGKPLFRDQENEN